MPDVISTSGTNVVSTSCGVKNLTSDFVLFATLEQRYFNVEKALISDRLTVSSILKISHSTYLKICDNLSVKFAIFKKYHLPFQSSYCLFCLVPA